MDLAQVPDDQTFPIVTDDIQNREIEQMEQPGFKDTLPAGNRSAMSCSPHGRTDPEHIPTCEHKDLIDIFKRYFKISFFSVRKCRSLVLSQSEHTQQR